MNGLPFVLGSKKSLRVLCIGAHCDDIEIGCGATLLRLASERLLDALKKAGAPDLIFTHDLHDRHQDHRMVSELTWNTFRDHIILEYEIPKYEAALGQPNVYVQLSRTVAERKAHHLLNSYATQRTKRWFSRDTFLALMQLRGVECNARDGFAEAFHARKLVI